MKKTISPVYANIWFKPRETIDNVLASKANFKFYIPVILSSISANIGELRNDRGYGLRMSIFFFIVGALLSYIMVGIVFPWLVLKSGSIWKGRSNFKQLQVIFGLSQIPLIIALIYQIINLLFGRVTGPDQLNSLLYFIAWLFSLRILIFGVAKVQGFTYGLAIVNLVVSSLPFIILALIMM